jgi:prepilin-type N-terminal cleavage/methylation domain-containing protein
MKEELMGNKNQNNKNRTGFTLIELLVVIAIIGLLSSIALIALMSGRQKSRDVKRLGDMTQMNTGLELYFTLNKGYPSVTTIGGGVPAQDMIPSVLAQFPLAPEPPDGNCDSLIHPLFVGDPVTPGTPANTYFYLPSGTPYTLNGKLLYPDYAYFFCLGALTGGFPEGSRILTPQGVR